MVWVKIHHFTTFTTSPMFIFFSNCSWVAKLWHYKNLIGHLQWWSWHNTNYDVVATTARQQYEIMLYHKPYPVKYMTYTVKKYWSAQFKGWFCRNLPLATGRSSITICPSRPISWEASWQGSFSRTALDSSRAEDSTSTSTSTLRRDKRTAGILHAVEQRQTGV